MTGKTTLHVQIDSDVKKALESRAKKNYLELDELVSDILRRSVLSGKKNKNEKITEDTLINIFSRSRKGRKAKK